MIVASFWKFGPGKGIIFRMGMSGLICRWEVITGVVFGDLGVRKDFIFSMRYLLHYVDM